jgi:hypothetical protein
MKTFQNRLLGNPRGMNDKINKSLGARMVVRMAVG